MKLRLTLSMTVYNLHYVGKGLYSRDQFEQEAAKHGVARALPARVVRTFSWGDRILLAQWIPDAAAQRATMTFQETLEGERSTKGMRFKRFGNAEIFGSFRVTGLNMRVPGDTELEAVAKAALTNMLRVVGVDTASFGVRRRCGSYTVGATYYVTDDIATIMDKAAIIEGSYGVKFKWFVAGVYEPLRIPVTLSPARFSRGVVRVEVDGFPETPAKASDAKATDTHAINFILDYSKRSYVRKGE